MKIDKLIDNFIKKILENDLTTLEEKINFINELLNNLIDHCIKKKIYYFIENNIGYNNIINSFKQYLCEFIQKLIDPDDTIIIKYIDNNNNNFDNFSDINSLLLNKFKIKNKVNFKEDISIINYSEEIEFNNYKDYILPDSKFDYNKKLPIYIKILISQDKYIIEFIEKLNFMCNIIANSEIVYNKNNPFE